MSLPLKLPETPQVFKIFINGQWSSSNSGELIERRSPGHGTPVSHWPSGNERDIDEAVSAARIAFEKGPWPRMSCGERAEILYRTADLVLENFEDLALTETLETGKPINQSRGEIQGAAEIWRFAAGAARTLHGETFNNLGEHMIGLVLREPIGVVGLITPWNFPFFILAERLPFILASGCTTVVKPAETTSGSTLKLCNLLQEAGLPNGVVNVVTGYGPVAGQRLLDSSDVDMVSFTGSTEVGRKALHASASNIKKVGLELGGKNPHVVFQDADIDSAADGVAFGMCFNAGQCCVGASRLVVHRNVAEQFSEKLSLLLGKVNVGDPLDENTQVGAMFNEAHLAKVLRHIEEAKESGATVVCGGHRTGPREGLFIAPTLMTGASREMKISRSEVFGPVLTVYPFDSYEEAIAIANDTEYGLAASIWSNDLNHAMRAFRDIRAGRIWVNTTLDNGPETPLGGFKQSGLGRETGLTGIEEYTEVKTVHVKLGNREPWLS
ncbi:MAG: aldehyde dehydrogenase family protein [SAR324 cluster bacterium]|nr:aldehyde dehydrogenase family protein [SAR324 cluster bacterium]